MQLEKNEAEENTVLEINKQIGQLSSTKLEKFFIGAMSPKRDEKQK